MSPESCTQRCLYEIMASIQLVGAACFCVCAVVKCVFGYISACVHSVIKAPGVIKSQTRRSFHLALTNTLVKAR